MTDITDQIAAWSECKHFAPPHLRVKGLEARLRTADEALRLYVAWCEAETTYVPTFYERMAMCAEAEHAARAYLAAREKER